MQLLHSANHLDPGSFYRPLLLRTIPEMHQILLDFLRLFVIFHLVHEFARLLMLIYFAWTAASNVFYCTFVLACQLCY